MEARRTPKIAVSARFCVEVNREKIVAERVKIVFLVKIALSFFGEKRYLYDVERRV